MKRFLLVVVACSVLATGCAAQQSTADSPATKEDIEAYLQVVHSHEMMTKTFEAMLQPIHQLTHEQYLKDKDKLPADFEARMNKEMDDFLKGLPLDEMMSATVPVYQKYLTKGDINELVKFYSSPTGQKLLREMPAMTAEAMQAMFPIMRQQVDKMAQRVQEETAQMLKDSHGKPGGKAPSTPN